MANLTPSKRCPNCIENNKSEEGRAWCVANCELAKTVPIPAPKAEAYADVTPYVPRVQRAIPRRIKCLDDGTEYESAKELAELLEVSDSAVCNCCCGRIITLKGKQYSYIGKEAREWMEQQRKVFEPKKNRRPSIPVKDRKTKEIYDSCRLVAEALGCGITTIYRQLTMDYNDPRKRFEYVEVQP